MCYRSHITKNLNDSGEKNSAHLHMNVSCEKEVMVEEGLHALCPLFCVRLRGHAVSQDSVHTLLTYMVEILT